MMEDELMDINERLEAIASDLERIDKSLCSKRMVIAIDKAILSTRDRAFKLSYETQLSYKPFDESRLFTKSCGPSTRPWFAVGISRCKRCSFSRREGSVGWRVFGISFRLRMFGLEVLVTKKRPLA